MDPIPICPEWWPRKLWQLIHFHIPHHVSPPPPAPPGPGPDPVPDSVILATNEVLTALDMHISTFALDNADRKTIQEVTAHELRQAVQKLTSLR